MTSPTSYYTLSDSNTHDDVMVSHFSPTIHAQGVWKQTEQHMAPASGVMAYELERFQARENMRIARISYEILGTIHFEPFTIETKIIRPGRTIELVESTLYTKERASVVARAWRLVTSDTSELAGLNDTKVPSYKDLQPHEGIHHWPGGYIQSLEARPTSDWKPGKGVVWLTSPYSMVENQTCSPFVKLIGLVDTANGIVPRYNALETGWIHPNVDLQIHLYRNPTGTWLGLETSQQIGTDGIGLTSSILHDEQGPFGRSEQILTLRDTTA